MLAVCIRCSFAGGAFFRFLSCRNGRGLCSISHLLMFIGLSGVSSSLHQQFQANTTQHKAVLSYAYLALRMIGRNLDHIRRWDWLSGNHGVQTALLPTEMIYMLKYVGIPQDLSQRYSQTPANRENPVMPQHLKRRKKKMAG